MLQSRSGSFKTTSQLPKIPSPSEAPSIYASTLDILKKKKKKEKKARSQWLLVEDHVYVPFLKTRIRLVLYAGGNIGTRLFLTKPSILPAVISLNLFAAPVIQQFHFESVMLL